ncbi:MAG: hypothetical protein OEZ59_06960 [Deltaproteobacteria bacterium]|nr:hypothetical protein [Deltaproteobacteria bacterium]
MLVKIIAMGHTPAVWKNIFRHLRMDLPDHPFAAGVFNSDDDISYLMHEFFPDQWEKDQPDFLLAEPPAGPRWQERLEFCRMVSRQQDRPVKLCLALATLHEGLRRLVQGPAPVRLILENGATLSVSDPGLLTEKFPEGFPRLKVNDHVTALLLRRQGRQSAEVRPEVLKKGALLGFGEIEGIRVGEKSLSVDKWLGRLRKETGLKLSWTGGGLIQEPQGLFLFPGIPFDEVAKVRLGEVTFENLLGLGHLFPEAASYQDLLKSIRKTGNRIRNEYDAHNRRLRESEARADLPVVCAGGAPLVRETLAALLAGRGFARCSAMEHPAEGVFREPTLLIQVGAWPSDGQAAQVEPPVLWRIDEPLEKLFAPLDGVLDWRSLSQAPLDGKQKKLTSTRLRDEVESAAKLEGKAVKGLEFARKRHLLLKQEAEVLQRALDKCALMLSADDAQLVWEPGKLPKHLKQGLVLSFDPEEAGAILQALAGLGRKRWLDLSSCQEPEQVAGLDLTIMDQYREQGLVVIAGGTRMRLEAIESQTRDQLEEAREQIRETGRAQGFYEDESARCRRQRDDLARRWVRDSLLGWMQRHGDDLEDYLHVIRERHEKRWFSRGLVRKVAVIPSSRENGEALLEGCRKVFPGLNRERSHVIWYDHEGLHRLPRERQEELIKKSREAGHSAHVINDILRQVMHEHNRMALDEYKRQVTQEMRMTHPDLLVIENDRETASELLEHLRKNIHNLAQTPVVLVLGDGWSPADGEPYPWYHTRVLLIRRLGCLSGDDFAGQLQTVFHS